MSFCWPATSQLSVTWSNYRHQADAFAMYQSLKHHGYDDDHIVLIVEDNLANDPRNAFARTFRKEINKNNKITIYDLFKELAKTTTDSHVTIYNNDNYGSVYTETMEDFFPQ